MVRAMLVKQAIFKLFNSFSEKPFSLRTEDTFHPPLKGIVAANELVDRGTA